MNAPVHATIPRFCWRSLFRSVTLLVTKYSVSAPWRVSLTLIFIFAAIAVGIVQSSFFEWAFHRYWLHRPWLPKDCFTNHTLIHHQLCKYDDTFHAEEEEQHEALTFSWWAGPVLIAINTAPWALIAWIFRASGMVLPHVAFLVTFAATMGIYYLGYEGTHFLMHKPTFAWIERSRPFRFIERHHRIHHVRMNRNLNVLLPLADLVLGTLVTEMPVVGATPRAARQMARRHSRFGRQILAGKPALVRGPEQAPTKGESIGNQETIVSEAREGAEAPHQGQRQA
ncbi:MAG TPA: hypothetical protein VK123_04810 [Candidatus Limnocylindrales bacterium]|nr:hypothetical protein [Candidatus Limnocylindrales bacterium]